MGIFLVNHCWNENWISFYWNLTLTEQHLLGLRYAKGSLMSWVVVIPKEGWTGNPSILLLVWQWLRTLGTFSRNTAYLKCTTGEPFNIKHFIQIMVALKCHLKPWILLRFDSLWALVHDFAILIRLLVDWFWNPRMAHCIGSLCKGHRRSYNSLLIFRIGFDIIFHTICV